jgi:hypothetical protein
MNQQENWTGGRSPDRGMTEIAILLTLLIFVVFGFVFYFFYQQVADLTEQTRVLTMRLTKLEQQAGNARASGLPVYTRKWSPSGANRSRDIKTNNEKPSGGAPNLDEVRQISDMQKELQAQVSNLAERLDDLAVDPFVQNLEEIQRKVEQLDRPIQVEGPLNTSVATGSERIKVGNDIQVSLVSCANKMMYLYCDIQLKNLGSRGRKIEVGNEYTFLADYSGRVFSISSFTFGISDGEEVRDKSGVFVSKARPVKLRFRFYDPPSGIPALASANFSIDGTTFPFEQILVEN